MHARPVRVYSRGEKAASAFREFLIQCIGRADTGKRGQTERAHSDGGPAGHQAALVPREERGQVRTRGKVCRWPGPPGRLAGAVAEGGPHGRRECELPHL